MFNMVESLITTVAARTMHDSFLESCSQKKIDDIVWYKDHLPQDLFHKLLTLDNCHAYSVCCNFSENGNHIDQTLNFIRQILILNPEIQNELLAVNDFQIIQKIILKAIKTRN